MANLGFGSSTDEWALSPDQTALALPDPGLAPPEPEGHGYDHGLPPSSPNSASEGEEEDYRGQFKINHLP